MALEVTALRKEWCSWDTSAQRTLPLKDRPLNNTTEVRRLGAPSCQNSLDTFSIDSSCESSISRLWVWFTSCIQQTQCRTLCLVYACCVEMARDNTTLTGWDDARPSHLTISPAWYIRPDNQWASANFKSHQPLRWVWHHVLLSSPLHWLKNDFFHSSPSLWLHSCLFRPITTYASCSLLASFSSLIPHTKVQTIWSYDSPSSSSGISFCPYFPWRLTSHIYDRRPTHCNIRHIIRSRTVDHNQNLPSHCSLRRWHLWLSLYQYHIEMTLTEREKELSKALQLYGVTRGPKNLWQMSRTLIRNKPIFVPDYRIKRSVSPHMWNLVASLEEVLSQLSNKDKSVLVSSIEILYMDQWSKIWFSSSRSWPCVLIHITKVNVSLREQEKKVAREARMGKGVEIVEDKKTVLSI